MMKRNLQVIGIILIAGVTVTLLNIWLTHQSLQEGKHRPAISKVYAE